MGSVKMTETRDVKVTRHVEWGRIIVSGNEMKEGLEMERSAVAGPGCSDLRCPDPAKSSSGRWHSPIVPVSG